MSLKLETQNIISAMLLGILMAFIFSFTSISPLLQAVLVGFLVFVLARVFPAPRHATTVTYIVLFLITCITAWITFAVVG